MQSPPVRMSLRSYAPAECLHAHEFHQLVLPLQGRMGMRVGASRGIVGAGSAVLVTGDTPHAFRADGENRFLVLDMPRAGALPDCVLERAGTSPFFMLDETLGHLARYLACETAEGAIDAADAHHAMSLVIRAVARRVAPASALSPAVERAWTSRSARYGEPLTVAMMAQAAGMGLSRFHERFRLEIGRTPADYLADIRLDRAALLLRGGALPLAEIALAVGFSDQSALTRCMRRRRGTTPGALRRGRAGREV